VLIQINNVQGLVHDSASSAVPEAGLTTRSKDAVSHDANLTLVKFAYCAMFEKTIITEQLVRAERDTARAEQHVQEQEDRIAAMERSGLDTTQSRDLLRTFRATLRLHIQNRDYLRARLKTSE
jgi:pantothenate kinase-related protein Tda10